MGWRLRIRHVTRASYQGDARASYNEARMTPLTLPGQRPAAAMVTTAPSGPPVWTYRDYWGTLVSAFDIHSPHRELTVTADATVDTSAAAPPAPPLSWASLRERSATGWLLEYLAATPRTTVSAELVRAAGERTAGADPVEAAAEVATWVSDRVTYVPGATGVHTSAQQAWDLGQGVCQDITHLTVALLRAVGLPARYVSGYLHPDPSARPGDTVAGQSHAWVEYWAGAWVAADPTNRAPVGERHVVVARGRDYADVAPLKGIYHGPPGAAMQVRVDVTRLV